VAERGIADGRDAAWAMCRRKTKLSRRGAQKFAFKVGLRAYHCPICTCWHVAKQVPSEAAE